MRIDCLGIDAESGDRNHQKKDASPVVKATVRVVTAARKKAAAMSTGSDTVAVAFLRASPGLCDLQLDVFIGFQK